MEQIGERSTITGEIAPAASSAVGKPGFAQLPFGMLIAAFLVGNVISPLYEHVIGPLLMNSPTVRGDRDETFISEFNSGLNGPQAFNQSYLIGYFAREYTLAAQTTRSIQNRCSVAETILTYAQDPEIPHAVNILYAMPDSVAEDVAGANAWRGLPRLHRLFTANPSCFMHVGQVLRMLRKPPARITRRAASASSLRIHDHPLRGSILPQLAANGTIATTDGTSSTLAADWNPGPTPGSLIAGQLLSIYVAAAAGGQIVHLRNTNLAGMNGEPLTVQLACRECEGAVGFDPAVSYTVPSVTNVRNAKFDHLIFIPTHDPVSFVWRAQLAPY